MSANTAKLMDSAEAADDGIVFHNDMPGEGAIVGENDVVSDQAIMSNVGVGEKVVVTADHRSCIRHSATVDGAKFAKAVVIAHLQERSAHQYSSGPGCAGQ